MITLQKPAYATIAVHMAITQNANVKSQNYNAKVKTDLKQRCYYFSLQVIELMNHIPNKRSAWIISDQLIRSATSIGANLVEAKASSSRKEFKKFNEIALKSANETRYWLGLLRDAKLVGSVEANMLLSEATEVANMLAVGVIKLKSTKF